MTEFMFSLIQLGCSVCMVVMVYNILEKKVYRFLKVIKCMVGVALLMGLDDYKGLRDILGSIKIIKGESKCMN